MPEVSRKSWPQGVFWSVWDAGPERGVTVRANRDAFDAAGVPRVGVVREGRDLSATVFGAEVPLPAPLAPVGTVWIVHPAGAPGSARAAAGAGTVSVVPNFGGHALQEAGVRRVLEIFREGPGWTLGLIGCPSAGASGVAYLGPRVVPRKDRHLQGESRKVWEAAA